MTRKSSRKCGESDYEGVKSEKYRLETSLPPTDPSSASLVLEGATTVERGRPTRVAAAAAVRGKRALWLGLCFVDPQRPAGQLLAVERFDSFRGIAVAFELDEGKPAHTTSRLVEGHHHVLNSTDGAEGLE